MGRKTYHHLNVGDYVIVEKVEWDSDTNDIKVVSHFTNGEVVHVGAKQMKIKVDWKGNIASFSRQGGQEWGSSLDGYRIAPAHAQVKGAKPKPYEPPKALPSKLDLHLNYHVYPGQPLVSAASIVAVFPSVEAAAVPSLDSQGKPHGWCEAESCGDVHGAGGQAGHAVDALMKYRLHGSIDKVIADLHEGWHRTVRPGSGNHEKAFEPGQEKAEKLEPMLREALKAWF